MTATSPAPVGVNERGMAAEAMRDYLSERLGDRALDATIAYGQLTVTVEPAAWVDAARLCKEDPNLACAFFDFVAGIDRGERGFEVVAHLYSVRHRHEVTLRALAPGGREAPTMPSLTGVYGGANWSERETYDMFGIDFQGHPGLLPRMLTVENFEGWPLRKEFLLSTREAKPWPGAKEPEERSEAGETADAGSVTAAQAPVSAEDKAQAAKDKAERAKAKAAAMRAKKAAERAGEQAAGAPAPSGDPSTGVDAAAGRGEDVAPASVADQAVASDAQRTTSAEAAAAGDAAPGSDLIAESAERFGGGDTEDEAAAAAATAAGDPTGSTPEGAAEVAGSGIAKDAAAGASAGDTAARAPQDAPGDDQPVVNPEAEAKAAQGAPPSPAGAPGVEAEGRSGGAERQTGATPAADTPGMTSPTQEAEAATTAPGTNDPPAPGPETNVPSPRGAQAAADVPLVPAPGSEAAPTAEDRPTEDVDPRAGIDHRAEQEDES